METDFTTARRQMVETQLIRRGIRDERVLAAFRTVVEASETVSAIIASGMVPALIAEMIASSSISSAARCR